VSVSRKKSVSKTTWRASRIDCTNIRMVMVGTCTMINLDAHPVIERPFATFCRDIV
jgi:hypothetical protein